MGRLHFVLEQGGELTLVLKAATGPYPAVGEVESSPHFSCHKLSLSRHDLAVSPRQQPCFFAWQRVDFLLQMPRIPQGKEGYQIWLTNQCLVRGKEDQDRLFVSTTLAQSVGRGRLRILDGDGTELAALELEVFPQKLDYRQDYAMMMRDMETLTHRLATSRLRRTYTWLDSGSEPSLQPSDWEIMRDMANQLLSLLERWLLQAGSDWQQVQVWQREEKIRRPSPKQMAPSQPKAGYAWGLQSIHNPVTQRNHLIFWALRDLQTLWSEWLRALPPDHANSLERVQLQLQSLLQHPAFQGLPQKTSSSQTSISHQFPPIEQQLLLLCHRLQQGLSISQAGWLKLGHRDIHHIYETWAVLKVISLIDQLEQWEISSPGASPRSAKRTWLLSEDGKQLRKGSEPLLFWQHNLSGDRATLWYQRPFSLLNEQGISHIPDLTLEVQKVGHQTPFRFFFEIKYQLEAEAKGKWGPPKSGLAQLHRYRDAILSQKQTQGGTTTAWKSWGGVLLFPYPEEEESFSQHPQHLSLQSVQIGAIPLHPGPYRTNQLLQEVLAYLLDSKPDQLEEQMIDYRKG